MSKWSRCNAILSVYTYQNIPNFERLIKYAIQNAPMIMGSEGCCEYTAIEFSEGSSSSMPCNQCIYYNSLKCNESTPNSKLPCYNWNFMENILFCRYIDRCKIIITDHSGLRDKSKEETHKEFKELLKYFRTVFDGLFKIEVICKKIS